MNWLPSALQATTQIAEESAREGAFVVLDYDGTLSVIAPRPELATIAPEMRAAVERLSSAAPVAVLSGRALDDVAERVGLEGLVYAGCHGLEMRGPSIAYRHEAAAALAPALASAAVALEVDLEGIDGLIVEDKGLALAVHRRLVAVELHDAIDEAVTRVAEKHPGLRHKSGKMVDEIVPDVDWHKGKALTWLGEQIAPERHVIYVGDDRTDEDAFAAIEATGVGIVVAVEPRPTKARYRLRDTEEVLAFLEALGPALSRCGPRWRGAPLPNPPASGASGARE